MCRSNSGEGRGRCGDIFGTNFAGVSVDLLCEGCLFFKHWDWSSVGLNGFNPRDRCGIDDGLRTFNFSVGLPNWFLSRHFQLALWLSFAILSFFMLITPQRRTFFVFSTDLESCHPPLPFFYYLFFFLPFFRFCPFLFQFCDQKMSLTSSVVSLGVFVFEVNCLCVCVFCMGSWRRRRRRQK